MNNFNAINAHTDAVIDNYFLAKSLMDGSLFKIFCIASLNTMAAEFEPSQLIFILGL